MKETCFLLILTFIRVADGKRREKSRRRIESVKQLTLTLYPLMMEERLSVRSYFDHKTVFLTGATGFLGKFIAEKLLTSCNVKKIYVLIRAKKGRSAEDRINDLRNDQMFKFRTHPDKLSILTPITGDISEEGLGISYTDRLTLMSEVNVVIHSAATVKFDEPFK